MTLSQLLRLTRLASIAVVFASGCAILSSSSSSTGDANKVTIEVAAAPPAEKIEKVETRPASPGYGYIWVNGYWDYLDGNYVWRNGRWTQARPDYEYVRARYEYDGKTWLFHRPHWKRRRAAEAAPTTKSDTPTTSTPAASPTQ